MCQLWVAIDNNMPFTCMRCFHCSVLKIQWFPMIFISICFIHSDKHNEDYENRKNGVPATSSPRKRPRVDEISAEDWFDFKYSFEKHFKISTSKKLPLKSLLYCFPQDLTKIIPSNPFCGVIENMLFHLNKLMHLISFGNLQFLLCKHQLAKFATKHNLVLFRIHDLDIIPLPLAQPITPQNNCTHKSCHL